MSVATTAEELAQRAMDVNVLDERQLRSVWSELGTRTASLDDFSQLLVRKGWLTNFQLDRLTRGLRDGYFYGDYKVLYGVGSGAFARVFRAVKANRQADDNKIYAIKVLRSRWCSDAEKTDLFRREGELGKTLVHPNIVSIHEVVSRPGLHFLVMDFIEGQNLREAFRRRRRFEWKESAEIIGNVLAGLQYAFQQGVTHRDLKMSNVLLGSDGKGAKLIDFGLAALENVGGDDGADRTVEYAALEKATGVRKDDTRSDVFFAGYILHQMLSGVSSLPSGRDRMQRFGKDTFKEIRPILEHAPDTPMPIAMALGKALELDPSRRYQTPGDMLTDLKIAIRRAESGAESGEKKQDLESREGIKEDGTPRKIMVIESNTKRQDVLRDLFKRNGYRVLVTNDPNRALARFNDDVNTAEVLVFCSGTIGQEAVNMFNTFGSNTGMRDLPAVLLLDEGQKSWAPLAATDEHRPVLTMPCTLRQLRQAVADSLLTSQARA